ncbi:lipopolysaccharide kinase InaA family protein [Halodurantibacterium flavum]|uniref:Lipopolysaccharide kinase InaA family protein n=1 Tax=Halodurantibacterium flavum TaxID=1382802 RepID=A0ABW4S5K3_9RHOB
MPDIFPPNTLGEALLAELRNAPRRRVQRIEAAGRAYWVKQVEDLSLRWRLQKGNPRRAFEKERRGLHVLRDAGLPVPPIVAEGPSLLVTQDSGPTLDRLVREPDASEAGLLPAMAAAGTALAQMHMRGFAHGRPSIKDICWDGEQVTFIDLERFSPRRGVRRRHVVDLIALVFSIHVYAPQMPGLALAAADAYRASGDLGVWRGAQRLCALLRPLDLLTRSLQQRPSGREFRAIPLTLQSFSR